MLFKDNTEFFKILLRVFWGLHKLDFPDNLPVKDQQHIADHPKHEDLNTHDNEEYSKNSERNMINALQPFENYINAYEQAENRSEQTHHPKIEHRVVHPCKPVYGANDLDAVMEW